MCEEQPATAEDAIHFKVEDVLVCVDAGIQETIFGVHQRVDVDRHDASVDNLW